MKPCMECGKEFVGFSPCPGHLEKTGIKDHCKECCDSGKCSAIEKDKLLSSAQSIFEQLEPWETYVNGYHVSSKNI